MSEHEDLVAALKSAWEAVASAQLPEHVQSAALTLAFEAVSSGAMAARIPPAPGAGRTAKNREGADGTEPDGNSTGTIDSGGFLSSLARKADMEEERVARLFVVHGDKVEIIPPDRRLGKDSAARFRTVAVLMVPALTAFKQIESVPTAEIKTLGEAHGASDENRNFAKYIDGIAGYSIVGSARKKELKLTPGWEDTFAAAVADVLGEPPA